MSFKIWSHTKWGLAGEGGGLSWRSKHHRHWRKTKFNKITNCAVLSRSVFFSPLHFKADHATQDVCETCNQLSCLPSVLNHVSSFAFTVSAAHSAWMTGEEKYHTQDQDMEAWTTKSTYGLWECLGEREDALLHISTCLSTAVGLMVQVYCKLNDDRTELTAMLDHCSGISRFSGLRRDSCTTTTWREPW